MATVFTPETRASVLDIKKVYKELAGFAMGEDSPYMRAKDTLLKYFEETQIGADLSAREKAEMLSGLIEKTSINMSNELLGTAVKVAMENRDSPYTLAKIRADVEGKQFDNDKSIEEKKLLVAKTATEKLSIDKGIIEGKATQAGILAKTGYKIGGSGKIPAASATIAYKLAGDVMDGRLKQANLYSHLAGTYRKEGHGFSAKLTEAADQTFTLAMTGAGTDDAVTRDGLTWAQNRVAVRQEKGFTDNMWQHAANSSANTIGLLLSSGNDSLVTSAIAANPSGSLAEMYAYSLNQLMIAT